VLFTGLSNSNHFGDEYDSPEPLRYLALAFLNKANQVDPLGDPWKGEIKAAAKLIQNSCTGVLFGSMKNALHHVATANPELMNIYAALIPPAW
jgi:hypothetical protein